VATSHAEIRLHDWEVVVTDRASEGGTFVFEPGSGDWEQLRPYEPRTLPPGTHLAFGTRIATFITPWTLEPVAPQETSERY
ncbi:MAG TPA: FHA domain-containing protein, partial [Acidimicrobiales bacterium]|nr:FHA domain-containing protein [Acidimicrobiales bacterium]